MIDIAIQVDNIGKAYRIGLRENKPNTLGEEIISWLKSPIRSYKQVRNLSRINRDSKDSDVFWALQNISFQVKKGEVFGVIGKNGAGKSTLLKILSQITEPSTGRIDLYGKVASLLEVGTGFNPELTGRENVYLNGTILGMSKHEIDVKYKEIVDFSGVEQFMETPVKRYSSGMKVRLAFAVAAHLEPEIMIIDEVLAVGDAEFQRKCIGKMKDISQKEGRTVIFVSHNMAAVENLCDRAILIVDGKISFEGEASSVISKYLQSSVPKVNHDIRDRSDRQGQGKLKVTEISFQNSLGEKINLLKSGMDCKLLMKYESSHEKLDNVLLGVGISDEYGSNLFRCKNDVLDLVWNDLPNTGHFVCCFPKLPLMPGNYSVSFAIVVNGQLEDKMTAAIDLSVVEGDFYNTGKIPPSRGGKFLVNYTLEIV